MPGAQERVLRRRISSIRNTKKITRAMELISATRVVKAVQRANEARPYSEHITQVITDLAAAGAEVNHPLLREVTDVRTVGVIVISSDRGLAGPYNAGVIRAGEREVQSARADGAQYRLVLIGKKAEAYFRFRGFDIDASFTGITDKPTYEDARAVAAHVTSLFTEGGVDRVDLVYTQYVSMGTQRVVVRRFLPLETSAAAAAGDATRAAAFEFEPSPAQVLEALLPRYVEARLFSALLDASASEHANRQRAMKAATDNAEELITKLSRKMNQARQDSITTEIMEIVGGAEALGADRGNDPDDLLLDHLSTQHLAQRLVPDHLFAHSPES